MARSTGELELSEDLRSALDREGARRGVTWSATAIELLDEGVRMRRVPGIVFMDGPIGRRAAVAGTGLDVWEVIGTWLEVGRDEARLRDAYDWLGEAQLQAALQYYELYPAEIDARLESEEYWTEERIHAEYPFTRGGYR